MSCDQFPQRLRPIARSGVRGSRVGHRLAHVAKVLVEHVRQQVDDRRLAVSGQNQAAAAIGLEVLGHRGDPVLETIRIAARRRHTAARRHAELRGDRPGQPLDLPGPQRQAMVGLGAGAAHGRFDHVQPIHPRRCGLLRRGPHAPPGHEVGRVAEVPRTALQEVGIQRQHHVGLAEIVNRVDRFAKRHLRPVPGHIAVDRLVDVPFCLGQVFQQGFDLPRRASARRWFRSTGADPAPRCCRCFCMASRMPASASPQVRVWPRWVDVWERSGS